MMKNRNRAPRRSININYTYTFHPIRRTLQQHQPLFLQPLPLTRIPHCHPVSLYTLGRWYVDFGNIVDRCRSLSRGRHWRCRRSWHKRWFGQLRRQYQRRSLHRMIRSVPVPSLNARAHLSAKPLTEDRTPPHTLSPTPPPRRRG